MSAIHWRLATGWYVMPDKPRHCVKINYIKQKLPINLENLYLVYYNCIFQVNLTLIGYATYTMSAMSCTHKQSKDSSWFWITIHVHIMQYFAFVLACTQVFARKFLCTAKTLRHHCVTCATKYTHHIRRSFICHIIQVIIIIDLISAL